MSRRFDLTVSEQLALGFGAMLATLALFGAAVLTWSGQSERAQQTYAERTLPLVASAQTLERDLLYVAIDLRGVLLEPGDALRRTRLRSRTDATRAALGRLESAVRGTEDAVLLTDLTPRVELYLDRARALLEQPLASAAGLEEARELGELRESALAEVERFILVQEEHAAAARDAAAAARARVRTLTVASLFLALLLGAGAVWLLGRGIRRPLGELTEIARALEGGDWRPARRLAARQAAAGEAVPARSEARVLAHAFATAAAEIENRQQELEARAEIAGAVSSTLSRKQLADRALRPIVEHVRAEAGVIYWLESEPAVLHPIAAHALDTMLRPVREGEGIPGQAARTRHPVLVHDVPRDSPFTIRFGYDQAPPRTVAAVPILFQETVQGVLLVASLRELDTVALAFLENCARKLGVGLQNAASYTEAQRLLTEIGERNQQIQAQNEQLQAQAEEIQAQNEEMRQQSEELRRQTEALAESDERKNHFLGVLAHELRNPMAPIMASLEILRRVPPGSEQAVRAQEVIARQAKHLIRLIDDLLDVTRISQGKVRIERESLDLSLLARGCIEDQASTARDRSLVLEVDLPAAPLWVHGDRTRLAQVIGNLITNAMKFTDPGGRIRLQAREDAATGQAVLQVADTGIGMDKALIPRLFQPFSQGNADVARGSSGLGLGLALVKSLVSLHEGTVEARSDGPGKGSEFTVRLPLGVAVDRQSLAAMRPAAAERNVAPEAREPWKVLIIEDNRDGGEGLKALLELEGHAVALVHDGAAGLEKARSFRPHLVLCDIGLPGMDGYEVARRLRAEDCGRSALLVALTGYAAEIDRVRSAAAGFDRHFAKPLDPERFEELSAELGRRYSSAESSSSASSASSAAPASALPNR